MKRQATLEVIVKAKTSENSNPKEQIWKVKNFLENDTNAKDGSSARIKDGKTKDYLEERKSLEQIHESSKEDRNNIPTLNEDILDQRDSRVKIKDLVDDNLSKTQRFIKPSVAKHQWQTVMRKTKRRTSGNTKRQKMLQMCFTGTLQISVQE
jgi:hypothetical protein